MKAFLHSLTGQMNGLFFAPALPSSGPATVFPSGETGTCHPRALLLTEGSGVGGGNFLLFPRGVEGVDGAIGGGDGSGGVGEDMMGVDCPVSELTWSGDTNKGG